MRENIGLYRGKTTPKPAWHEFNEIWVYGDLLRSGDRFFIHPWANAFQTDHELTKLVVVHEVDPSTVGQYTGLTDKNGKLIFEGDIMEGDLHDERDPSAKWRMEVTWLPFGWGGANQYGADIMDDLDCKEGEVIGNIHDDPELLERGRPD